jgi:hypothetical protein
MTVTVLATNLATKSESYGGRGVPGADGHRELSEAVPPALWVSQLWCALLR